MFEQSARTHAHDGRRQVARLAFPLPSSVRAQCALAIQDQLKTFIMATQHCECASMPGVRRTIGAITLVDGRRTQLPERSPSRSSPSCPSSCALTLISSTEALREVARTRMHTPNA